ncbi:Unknown protein, partial [Striga hermonthica]
STKGSKEQPGSRKERRSKKKKKTPHVDSIEQERSKHGKRSLITKRLIDENTWKNGKSTIEDLMRKSPEIHEKCPEHLMNAQAQSILPRKTKSSCFKRINKSKSKENLLILMVV